MEIAVQHVILLGPVCRLSHVVAQRHLSANLNRSQALKSVPVSAVAKGMVSNTSQAETVGVYLGLPFLARIQPEAGEQFVLWVPR